VGLSGTFFGEQGPWNELNCLVEAAQEECL
jgi:hypothetical protein